MNNYKFHIKETLKLAYPVVIGQLGHMMLGVVDSLMVGRLGAVQLAIYSYAMAPVNQIQGSVMKNISALAFPKLSENSLADVKRKLPAKAEWLL